MWVEQKARVGLSVKICTQTAGSNPLQSDGSTVGSRPINLYPPRARSYLRHLDVILAYFGRGSVLVWYQINWLLHVGLRHLASSVRRVSVEPWFLTLPSSSDWVCSCGCTLLLFYYKYLPSFPS